MTIYELNEKYFELYSRLNENREFVSATAYKAMSRALDKQYDDELRTLTGSLMLDTVEADFIQRYRIRKYIPRRLIFGYNRIGKAFMRRCKADFREYLAAVLAEVSPPPPEKPDQKPDRKPEEPEKTTALPAVLPTKEVAPKEDETPQ